MMITIIPASAAGTGTSNDPYVITNQSELQSISNDLSAYYILGNDIDLSGVTWTPIGSSSNPVVTGFHGNLDGYNHTISNLYLNGTVTDYIGLFSVITAGAQIKNIMFTDCTVLGKSNVGLVFGACIMADGVDTQAIILNVDSENCTVIGSSYAVGGIAGISRTYADIAYVNCDVSNGTVESTSSNTVGGIAGYGAYTNSSAAFTGCTANGMHVKASSNNVGGIAGYGAHTNSSAAFTGCTAEMCTVYATSNYAGGICGRIYAGNTGTFTGCAVKYSSIVAPSYAAGICPAWA
ncbi:MAG: hypothetical protein PHQ11_17510 [Paludibacter sp.]|nr:hypothetical protein [Paludibacter sp.]